MSASEIEAAGASAALADGPPYRVPDGTRVYAVGDIHGRVDLLRSLRSKIVSDAKESARGRKRPERKVIVYLGDYVDRGPASFEVVDLLIEEPLEGFASVFLKGNHEDYMLKFLAGDGEGLGWLFNGGEATLASYGVDPGDWQDLDQDLLRDLRAHLADALPDSHAQFLETLDLHHREGGYLFVHAGIRPDVALEDQDENDLMWIREDFLYSETEFPTRVVHGHTISWEPDVQPNRIGIDTGAFVSGELTCLVVEGEDTRFITATR